MRAGIFRSHPVGPIIIESNLTATTYETLLPAQSVPAIQRLVNGNLKDVYFQQDGAPPQYGLRVRQYLKEISQDSWIGRRDGIEWPVRSPDFTHFFCGISKGLLTIPPVVRFEHTVN